MVSTTASSIEIGWTGASANGCPITGYKILRNTGSGDAPSINVDSTTLSMPSLRQYDITGLTLSGHTYRF